MHEHTPLPAKPEEWPSGREIAAVCDIENLTATAIGAVTADDLLRALKTMPPHHQHFVLSALGLRKAATINRGMAAQLLARLRGGEPGARTELLRDVISPVISALDGGASPEQWSAMLGSDDRAALDAFAARPAVSDTLAVAVRTFSPALLAAGLTAAINADTAASAIALALLAADYDAAREAHAALLPEHPQLPAIPTSTLAELLPAERLARLGVPKSDITAEELADLLDDLLGDEEKAGEPEGEQPTGDTGPLFAGAISEDDVQRTLAAAERRVNAPTTAAGEHAAIMERAADLLAEWSDVTAVAGRVLHALQAGDIPSPPAVLQVLNFAAFGQAVVNKLQRAVGTGVLPTRDGVDQALTALEEREANASEDVWLRRLTMLQGPPALDDALDDVRVAAADALADSSIARDDLRGLWRLLELTAAARRGEHMDFAELAAAQSGANAAWPNAGAVITAAAVGAVHLPEETAAPAATGLEPGTKGGPARDSSTATTDDAAVQTPGHDFAADHEVNIAPTASSCDVPDSDHSALAAEPNATGADDSEGADIDDDDDVPGHTAEASAEPAAASTLPAEEGLASYALNPRDTKDLDEPDDLEDLDALLDAGAGAALAAVSGPRRRATTPPVPPTPLLSAPVPAAAADSDGEVEPAELLSVAAALLPAERFGLAADLLESSGAPQAPVAARRLTAYATQLTSPTGHLASAFAETATQVSRDALGEDRGGQLLALAAAARVALLAPSAGPASVLMDLLPCVSERPALTEALTAFADASRTGIVVLAETADVVGTLAAAETAAADAAAAAAELVSGAARRVIKYIPANGVYQAWMNPDGDLGALLTQVAANDPSTVAAVRDAVVKLRGKANKAIDTTFAAQRRNNSNRIVAGSRSSLVARWEEAVELAARWTALAERVTERQAAIAAGAWQAGPLTKLRHRVGAVREDALVELAAVQKREEPIAAAAVEAARELIAEAFAICDGGVPDGPEPPAAFAAHAELLATELPLAPDTLLPDGGLSAEHLPALLALAGADPVDTATMYAIRAEHGDHDLTAALIAGLRAGDPTTAAALDRRRSADITAQAGTVVDEVAALATLIDTRRLAGTLDDQPWAALAARAEALADPTRRDFGRIRAAVVEVSAELDAHGQRRIAATLDRIDERARDNAAVAENGDFLADLARGGQVASAEEYLETILAGGHLPAMSDRVDHLARFFPAIPQLAVDRPALLAELHAALSGRDVGDGAETQTVGLNLAALSEARRDAGRKALGSWMALTGRSKAAPKVDVPTALQAVLAQAGLEFAEAKAEPTTARHGGRQWMRLSGVTGLGPALTPALGSAMSPDGGTLRVLLVKQAPTPATLIEWMSSETPDHTVLTLWLAGALSPSDRRAIADAARGRPNPPLMLLDAAALAYLVCQNEPRRATFEATALPFTAASPYRDTPGDTPREMFYGRTDELAAVVDLNGPSFVSGGRQLGKSALLRVAKRRFEETEGRHAVLISVFTVGGDGRPERLWGVLWPHLARLGIVDNVPPTGLEVDLAEVVYAAVLRWLEADPRRALLILLDEADAFLDADAAGALFKHVDTCRRLMWDSNRRAKVVFAGLHRTARFESLPNQPLSHLGRPISVGPLRPQHAHDLITEPLAALGFTFDDNRALPARILAMANNMPALLQLFGQQLVAQLTAQPVPADGPPQVITDDDVDDVFANAELKAAFREKYVLTLNLDHRYLVIAYCVAAAAHEHGVDRSLNLVELSDMARQHWPEGFSAVGADDFRGLVTECVDLGVLAGGGGRYRLRTPTVLRLLGTEEEVLETLYTASERMVVPSVSDAGSFRRRVGEGSRSPLTEGQLGRLFDARRQVLTVTGSPALGGDAVLSAVEAAWDEEAHRVGAVTRVRTASPDGIRGAVTRVGASSALLLVDGQNLTIQKLCELLSAAEVAVADAARDVTVAIVTAPTNAAAWASLAARIDLDRLDEPGLRMWCDEDGLPFRDEDSRALLMAATGGWPRVVAQAAQLAAAAGPATGSAKVLADLDAWLNRVGGHRLAVGAGLGPNTPALTEAFRSAVDLCGPDGETPEVLAELLELDDRVDLAALAQAERFDSLTDVIAALTALGCLTVTATGRLRPEPVLAAHLPGPDGSHRTTGSAA
ncbi:hypothetical protein SAMN06893097_104257 [Geodermatophilus sabuli]|uniref:Uncharacterized protein n=1 Tax=Geodermatophilus sabuli TaxID=1564158 RepID=A0A285EBN7_9ACTN|nr:hypothetical protein SAMN06893097_104257 [Geodermatophilus sabuli]